MKQPLKRQHTEIEPEESTLNASFETVCFSDTQISTDGFSESEDENLNLDLDDSEMPTKPFFQDGVEQAFTEAISFVQFYFCIYIDLHFSAR